MLDLDKLEQLAKSATPGPWHQYLYTQDGSNDPMPRILNKDEFIIATTEVNWADEDEHIKTASFIAALNPQVVLELIAEVRSLRFSIEQKAGEIGRAEHRGNTVDYIYDKLENYSKQLGKCGDENRSLKQKLEVARIALENLPWRPQK